MQDETKKSRFSNFVKRAKKYAVISLGIGSLLFGGGRDQQQTDTDINNVRMVQSVTMPLSEKINFIVDNMSETDATSIPSDIVEQSKWKPSVSKIKSQSKKDSIRQNLLKYISLPEGERLFSSLDVTKIQFVDMPNLKGSKVGGLCVGKNKIFADFDAVENLPTVHHELTHVLQGQTNSYTNDGELSELEAHLNEIKFTHQAVQQGLLSSEKLSEYNQIRLFNYQRYNCDDAQFTLHYLHPSLTWEKVYRMQFLLLSGQNTEKQFFQYAQQLGLSGEKAGQFVQELSSSKLEYIAYKLDKQGNETVTQKEGDSFSPETMILTGMRDGTLITFQYTRLSDSSHPSSEKWQKIKERYEKGNHISETLYDLDGCITEETEIKGNHKKHTTFGTDMGAMIETIDFVDENGNQCQTISNNMHPNFQGLIVQNFVNGNLIKETKTSLDGTTEIKELKDGKWVTSSQALQQRLQKASGKTDSIPVNKQSSPEM